MSLKVIQEKTFIIAVVRDGGDNMMRFLFILQVKFRNFFSPIIYWILRKTVYRGELPDVWDTVKDYSMEEFDDYINEYKYYNDPLKGLLDFTLEEPNFFFDKTRKSARDCLPGYEKVYVNNGEVKRIDELKVGDDILSYNLKSEKVEYKKVIDIWKTGKKDVYETVFEDGKVAHSSKRHKFFCRINNVSNAYGSFPLEHIRKRIEETERFSWYREVPIVKEKDVTSGYIKKIKKTAQKESMYDLTVEDNNNFFLVNSGALVHNCDDWARMWYWWATHNGYRAWEIHMAPGPFRFGHATCVIEKDGRYYLADYNIEKNTFDSIDDAIKEFDWISNKLYWFVARDNKKQIG